MDIIVSDFVEKINQNGFSNEKFKIVRFKNINGNIHVVMVNQNDQKSEIIVALSILQDKNRFRIIKSDSR